MKIFLYKLIYLYICLSIYIYIYLYIVTTQFNTAYTYVEVAPTTVNNLDASTTLNNEKQFNTSIVIRVPEQSVR